MTVKIDQSIALWSWPSGLTKGLTTGAHSIHVEASSLRYHLVRFEMPAVMAFRIGVKVASFSAASSEVSRNSIVGKTREMVGTRSEENTC